MKRLALMFLILLSLSACTYSQYQATTFLRSVPEASAFLDEFPQAEVVALSWDAQTVEGIIDRLQEQCGDDFAVKDYYRVDATTEFASLTVWYDPELAQPECVIERRVGESEPLEGPQIGQDNAKDDEPSLPQPAVEVPVAEQPVIREPVNPSRRTEVIQEDDNDFTYITDHEFDEPPFIGDRFAPIRVDEYCSPSGPFCARYHEDSFDQILDDWIDESLVRYQIHYFPLSFHPRSRVASIAAECARMQDEDYFYDFWHSLYELQDEWMDLESDDAAKQYFLRMRSAQRFNINEFALCLENPQVAEFVDDVHARGVDRGVSGTPTLFINDFKMVGAQPYSAFEAALHDAKNALSPKQPIPEPTPPPQQDDPVPQAPVEESPDVEQAPPSITRYDVSLDDDPRYGVDAAPIKVVIFSDFECPFCALFNQVSMPAIRGYAAQGWVQIIYRDFPLSFHPRAVAAAVAAECVDEIANDDLYFAYHDMLFANQNSLDNGSLELMAVQAGIDLEEFRACMSDFDEVAQEVMDDFADGQLAGVSGAPTTFINGRKVVGAQPTQVFTSIIEEEIELSSTPALGDDLNVRVTPYFREDYRVGARANWDPVDGALRYQVLEFREDVSGSAQVVRNINILAAGSGAHPNGGAPSDCYLKRTTVRAFAEDGTLISSDSGEICEVGFDNFSFLSTS